MWMVAGGVGKSIHSDQTVTSVNLVKVMTYYLHSKWGVQGPDAGLHRNSQLHINEMTDFSNSIIILIWQVET